MSESGVVSRFKFLVPSAEMSLEVAVYHESAGSALLDAAQGDPEEPAAHQDPGAEGAELSDEAQLARHHAYGPGRLVDHGVELAALLVSALLREGQAVRQEGDHLAQEGGSHGADSQHSLLLGPASGHGVSLRGDGELLLHGLQRLVEGGHGSLDRRDLAGPTALALRLRGRLGDAGGGPGLAAVDALLGSRFANLSDEGLEAAGQGPRLGEGDALREEVDSLEELPADRGGVEGALESVLNR
ncbi:hypothetical protein EB118_09300 [bacterium]|nr:hypothetical protein [bacterium]